jgi:hypothetical protein
MTEEFSDFGDENTQTADTAQETTPAQEPENNAEKPAEASAEEFVFDTTDLKGPGVEVVQLGQKVSRLPVERMKFSTAHKSLISIVSPSAIATKTHYREGFGSYFCLGAGKKCCELDGLPRVKYVFPIVVYDIDDNFKLRSSKLQFRVLVVGQEQYDAIANIAQLNGPINQMDLAVQCSDDKYQKCTFTYANACRYKKGQKTLREVAEFWSANKNNILLPVASVKTLEDLTKSPSDENPIQVQTAEKVNFDQVFD